MNNKIAVIWVSLITIMSFIVIILDIAPTVKAPIIIYVDDVPGEGPGNPAEDYTSIQDAINASNGGDTVFVYSGLYYERLIVNKSINFTGENRYNTIIDGNDKGHVMEVIANNTHISGFKIRNHETIMSPWNKGIYLNGSGSNVISRNIIINCHDGIKLFYSDDNIIWGNNLSDNYNSGTYFGYSNNNTYVENIVTSTYEKGLFFWYSSNNIIFHNDFTDNNVFPQVSIRDGSFNNIWDNGYPFGGNYWSDYNGVDFNTTPAQNVPPPDGIGDTPYVIDASNQDNFPLMEPFNSVFLYPGWNLISIPYIQSKENLDSVLYSIKDSYDAVQWYNLNDLVDHWKHDYTNKPSEFNDFDIIDQKMGFWIHVTEPGGLFFEYPGIILTEKQNITLYPGWNLVGYPSTTGYFRTQGLNNLTFGTHVNSIWIYNAESQNWNEMSSSKYFKRGRGYWVHALEKCEWEIPL